MSKKTITLKGSAAKAAIESMVGARVKNDADAYARIVTRIHMEVSSGNMVGAVALLIGVRQLGPMRVAEHISGK